MVGTRRKQQSPRPRRSPEAGERPGATLFKHVVSLPVAGAVAYLGSALLRRGQTWARPQLIAAATLFLAGFVLAWLWASYAWRNLRDWRVLLALPLVGSSCVLTVAGRPGSTACVALRTYRVGVTPADVAIASGAVWVTDWHQSPGRLYRVALSGASSVAEVPVVGAFEVAGDDKGLWVTSDRTPEVTEIDPTTRTVVGVYAVPGLAGDIATSGEDVWMTFPDQRLVGRLDRRSKRLDTFSFGDEPASLAIDGGDVWVTSSGGVLYDVERTSGRIRRQLTVGRRPYGVFAADGAVWVAVTGEDSIVRGDPAADTTQRFRVSGAPSDLAVRGDRLWVISQDSGNLTVLDARTAELVHQYKLGGAPLKLELHADDVYVTNPATAEVHRVDAACPAP